MSRLTLSNVADSDDGAAITCSVISTQYPESGAQIINGKLDVFGEDFSSFIFLKPSILVLC